MISSFSLQRFRSYRAATLPLTPLTLLIGATAAGKTNALEAIRLFTWLAEGHSLSMLWDMERTTGLIIRGQPSDLLYGDNSTFCLGCVCNDTAPWSHLEITLQLGPHGLRIVGERISDATGQRVLYQSIDSQATHSDQHISVRYNNFARAGRRPHIQASNQQAIFTQLADPARFGFKGQAREIIPVVAATFQQQLQQSVFIAPVPHLMRSFSAIADQRLRVDAANLASVLYDLCVTQERHAGILAFLQPLTEQPVAAISFRLGADATVMLELVEQVGEHQRTVDATLLSDGTLRLLAIVAACFVAQPSAVVIMDEIDNSIEPRRAKALLESIKRMADERQLRVVIATQNPAVMDALPLLSMHDVVCSYRDPADGASRLIRFSDMPREASLLAQGAVGNLMTQGLVDTFVKDRSTPAQRKAAMKAWLKHLQAGVPQS